MRAFPGNIFRGRHKATPIENAGGGRAYERTRGTKPIMRVTGVEFVTVLHCNRTQPDTNRNSVNAFNGGREIFGQPGAVVAAFVQGFRVFKPLDDFCTSPPSMHPCLLITFSFLFTHDISSLCPINGKRWRFNVRVRQLRVEW